MPQSLWGHFSQQEAFAALVKNYQRAFEFQIVQHSKFGFLNDVITSIFGRGDQEESEVKLCTFLRKTLKTFMVFGMTSIQKIKNNMKIRLSRRT